MNRITRSIAAVLAIGLLASQPAFAAPWSFDSSTARNGKSYVHIQESYDVGQPSRVKLGTRSADGSSSSATCLVFPSEVCPESLLGNTYGDPETGASYPYQNLYFELVMPACEVAPSKDWCIDDLRIYAIGETPASAEFIGSVGPETTPAVPSRGIPSGGHISLWQGGTGSGFESLRVAAIAQVNLVYYPFSGSNYVAQDFNLQIIPYEERRGSNYYSIEPTQLPGAQEGLGGTFDLVSGCIWQREGSCGERVDSPEGVTYGVTLRSDIPIGEFFNGRLQDPNLSVDDSNGVSILSLDAAPVRVGEFGIVYDKTAQLESEMPFLTGAQITKPYFDDAMQMIDGFRELAGDKASGENTSWRLSTTNVSGLNSCYSNYGVAGLVTTNATTYEGDPPTYDSGYLNYKVAGMHFMANGQDLYLGTYDLVIKSEVARCLYGFRNAPISATVAVVGEQGEENIATTIVSEKDGWLKLAAYGFTFSEKEIQVQLRQSQIKTLSNFTSSSLSAKQKAEIRAVLAKSDGNTKFICTGIRYYQQPMRENIKVRARAKAACEYAKSINPNFSYWYQTKTTQARSYNGKVMVVSKG
ncbi:MAG: hypothetical protein DCO81_05850 [Candidatus Aquiluna sp. XM-24bin5]|nr:MAG: hypothetical protein DCO81_05850 [Candidatus Aquiluna sp. XM-24bin5]